MITGHCTLVGAGPGDPELLTLKALRAIQTASVVLVDDLVSAAIVALIPPDTRVIRVGKRGGCRSTPQAFIEKLMIRQARRGDHVVRLKGGDPFIFGRGGEEMQVLQEAGVPCTVVHGITAGLAAAGALGVPLTHRAHAHGVIFMTGHTLPDASGPDWVGLAHTARQARLTLVIYMGVRNARHIQDALLQGLPEHTPVAIVQQATLPGQRQALGTLGTLHATMVREDLGSPCVIVVGDVLLGLAQSQTQEQIETGAKPAIISGFAGHPLQPHHLFGREHTHAIRQMVRSSIG